MRLQTSDTAQGYEVDVEIPQQSDNVIRHQSLVRVLVLALALAMPCHAIMVAYVSSALDQKAHNIAMPFLRAIVYSQRLHSMPGISWYSRQHGRPSASSHTQAPDTIPEQS